MNLRSKGSSHDRNVTKENWFLSYESGLRFFRLIRVRFDAQNRANVFVISPSTDNKDVSTLATTTKFFTTFNAIELISKLDDDVTAAWKFKGKFYSLLVSIEDDNTNWNDFPINFHESEVLSRFQLIAPSPLILIRPFGRLHTKQSKWNNRRRVWILSSTDLTGVLTEN